LAYGTFSATYIAGAFGEILFIGLICLHNFGISTTAWTKRLDHF